MPTTGPLAQQETDVIFNQTALKQAELRAQGRSILQSFIGDDWSDDDDDDDRAATAAATTDAAAQGEMLIKGSGDDLSGLGHVGGRADEAGGAVDATATAAAATEKLRLQMLGKRAKHLAGATTGTPGYAARGHAASRPRPRPGPGPGPGKRKEGRRGEEEDEEEGEERGGRSGIGTRRERGQQAMTITTTTTEKQNEGSTASTPEDVSVGASVAKKRGESYLDQVLAQRAVKKRKQQQKKKKQ